MADWTSLADGLNRAVVGTFGREVLYLPNAGGSVALKAILQPGAESEETAPGTYAVLFIRRADLAQTPERGDQVNVQCSAYTVFDIEADGEGGIYLKLRRT